MVISKRWIAAVLAYIATEIIYKKYGYTIDQQWLDWAAEGIQWGLVALVAWLNRKKPKPEKPEINFAGDPNQLPFDASKSS